MFVFVGCEKPDMDNSNEFNISNLEDVFFTVDFGDNVEEVKQKMQNEPTNEFENSLLYDNQNCVGLSTQIYYRFSNGKLHTIVYTFTDEYSLNSIDSCMKLIQDYKSVDNKLIEKYGPLFSGPEKWESEDLKTDDIKVMAKLITQGKLEFNSFWAEKNCLHHTETEDKYIKHSIIVYDPQFFIDENILLKVKGGETKEEVKKIMNIQPSYDLGTFLIYENQNFMGLNAELRYTFTDNYLASLYYTFDEDEITIETVAKAYAAYENIENQLKDIFGEYKGELEQWDDNTPRTNDKHEKLMAIMEGKLSLYSQRTNIYDRYMCDHMLKIDADHISHYVGFIDVAE